MAIEKCTLGGGCFWCLDSAFRNVKGVHSVVSGYAGGSITNPSYDAVCSGKTGHAEVVQVTFDSAHVSFETLLDLFLQYTTPPRSTGKAPMWAPNIDQSFFTMTKRNDPPQKPKSMS